MKPATARQVLIGIKLHTQVVLLNDITNKVTRIALDILADMVVDRLGGGANRAPNVPGLFGRGQARFMKNKYSKYYNEELQLFSYNIYLHYKYEKRL